MVGIARCIAAIGTALLLLAALGGEQASAQSVTEFPIPTANSAPKGITVGPDGALWFTESQSNKIGRITTSGAITEFSVPNPNSQPFGIATGADGALWFTEQAGNKIGRITTAGTVTGEATVVTANAGPFMIAAGPDGAVWFTEFDGNHIGRLSRFDTSASEFPVATSIGNFPMAIAAGFDGGLWFILDIDSTIVRLNPSNGLLQQFNSPSISAGGPFFAMTRGPDGALWFTVADNPNNNASDRIGRVTTNGDINATSASISAFPLQPSNPLGVTTGPDGAIWFTQQNPNAIGRISGTGLRDQFPIPTPNSQPVSIVAGPDGALWFTEIHGNNIGRLSPPAATSPLFAATLPASRSIEIGHTATAFATIINTGPAAANCGIVPVTTVPGTFTFQTTDPRTNALTGSPNTPVSIASGQSQSFVVAFSPPVLLDSAQVPIDVVLGYHCLGVDAAATIVGVNTLKLTFDTNPVPDVIAIGLTPSNDGFAHTNGVGGTGIFATASSNVGIGGTLTARVRLSDITLPITATVCETNPGNGQCFAPPGPTVTTTINAGQNQTWSVFLEANGAVAADPAHNRAFFEFVDGSGVVRGSTSTAVTTQ